jgi:site-specific DNA-methyltransferase (adenine-specific)
MINQGIMSSESNKWYTPKYITDYIESNYGKITLDPCASDWRKIANINYTKEDDGLSKEWNEDLVFVNPPYGRGIKLWVEKCVKEQIKHKNTIIMLIPARPDTSYWHDFIFPNYKEIFFIKGRIKFDRIEGDSESAPFPSCLVVFSEYDKKIIRPLEIKK